MSDHENIRSKLSSVLLAEDCETDIKITLRAFERANFDAEIFIVHDGYELVEYLSGIGKYVDRGKYPMPKLIFLDINMPRYDGFTVLQKMKTMELEAAIPVVILSSSSNTGDIEKSYALGACSYIQKSLNFNEFVDKMKVFRKYWGEVSLLK